MTQARATSARLPDGHTLIGGNQNAFAREVDAAGKTVWEVKDGDLPGIKLNSVHEPPQIIRIEDF